MVDIEKLREDVKEVLKLAQEPDAKEGTIPFEDFWTDQILVEVKQHYEKELLMAKGYVCERCGRSDVFVSFLCDNCHRQVCRNCIVFRGKSQICIDCAYPKEGARINEPELVPA